jgi:phenylalanyl-tRNA synthetase alpha chain
MDIKISSPEEQRIRQSLEKRGDPEAKRMLRFLGMPDLSRTPGSPLAAIIERVKKVPVLKNFDDIKIPEIVSTHVLFDLFNMPPGHPARSTSDSYYVDEEHILITHDTVMWYFYLNHPDVKKKIEQGEDLGVMCYAKVYRKDEIDRKHMNVFHQFGGLCLVRDDKKTLTIEDLKNALCEIAQSIFGKGIKIRFNQDNFPYTDPSLEMEIEINGQWIEMLGCGMARKSVLANFGLTGYHGWAFGFGLERMAIVSMTLPDIRLLWSEDPRVKKQLKLGNSFVPVSKYPPITRDISFVVSKDFVPNNYFDLIRDIGGDLVEEVQLIDKYEDAQKFGSDKISYTYRIVYRSNERTLESKEVDVLQDEIYKQTAKQFEAKLR